MKKIPLTQGKFAIVDDEDYPLLNRWSWFAHNERGYWYAVRKHVRMHRFILGAKKGQEVDHANGNGLDNRKSNIRICTISQNQANANLRQEQKTSQFKGVCWHKHSRKWRAQIKVNGEKIHLGCFLNEIDAARAYDVVARHYFGEFARTNFQREEEKPQ